MKKLLIIVTLLVLVSCKKESQEPFGKPEVTSDSATVKSPEVLGKEIFENKGNCIACHLPDKKLIGPSLHDIAKIYKDKNADMVTFLKGDGEPLVDPSQFEVMKTNFAITEEMSDEELQALEAYIYSNLK
ncbi:cytochrome C552 [Flavobacterium aquariorum]|uniref:Cytochrome C552 n=1 Tax=Flavobacterium aquariorum TaxID=2217670 RepID=A0A2W7TYE1_9FLAO|nr:c-type cytochrome [Flavobacterium aquariorum]PZX95351.1 cytochrome C552 [Flavobacterium aquariorum]